MTLICLEYRKRGIKKRQIESKKIFSKYFLADFKFNVTAFNRVDENIPNESIKAKYKFTCDYIRSKDYLIPCSDTAYFVFKDKNFEQIRNVWSRKNLNSPKNMAVKQADFEKLFV